MFLSCLCHLGKLVYLRLCKHRLSLSASSLFLTQYFLVLQFFFSFKTSSKNIFKNTLVFLLPASDLGNMTQNFDIRLLGLHVIHSTNCLCNVTPDHTCPLLKVTIWLLKNLMITLCWPLFIIITIVIIFSLKYESASFKKLPPSIWVDLIYLILSLTKS